MIRGPRIVLRSVEESDFPLIHAWQNDPEVWWRMDYERPFSLEDIAESEARAREEGHPFVIVVDGRPVGRIGLNGFRRRDRICSLYLFVGDPSARGDGYGTESVATLVRYAFDRVDLRRVQLWTLAVNDAAIRVYERCGFVHEARLPERSFKDGGWVDHVVMSATRQSFAPAFAALDERFGPWPAV